MSNLLKSFSIAILLRNNVDLQLQMEAITRFLESSSGSKIGYLLQRSDAPPHLVVPCVPSVLVVVDGSGCENDVSMTSTCS